MNALLDERNTVTRFPYVRGAAERARAIAEAIGKALGIPTRSLDAGEAASHFGWLAPFAANDIPASSAVTRESLGWRPTGPGLLEGLLGGYLS